MTAQPLTSPDEGADPPDPILERYRRDLQEVFGELSIQGLPETRYDIGRLRLDQVFVRLRLRRRNRPRAYSDELGAGAIPVGLPAPYTPYRLVASRGARQRACRGERTRTQG